ncbi:hypothetical protein Patl1_11013 [Pistacia atlantica]|uniref:Uncharacterized protein n=1 Tax=Pistacia atlantica TaxID=434234 RepID=A0ACC1A549_9ROSI|nr:hypothetical protein Patl1_11013 [Pistacia atlantica]
MFFLVQLYLVSFLIGVTSAADPTYLYQDCPNATTFSRNSTYQCNLKFFHSSLVSNVTRSNGFSNGFYNATAGQDPNKVYGLFLCRGDITPPPPRRVNFATSDALKRCPVKKYTAWKHWRDGTPLQLLDSTLTESYSRNEVIKCIHMGLLCVQEDPTDRPTMATIVIMLTVTMLLFQHLSNQRFSLVVERRLAWQQRILNLINLKASRCHGLLMMHQLLKYILDNRVF